MAGSDGALSGPLPSMSTAAVSGPCDVVMRQRCASSSHVASVTSVR